MITPDYAGGGITNLMASLVRGFDGGDPGYPELDLLRGEDLRDRKSIVLIVIDGLGFNYVQEHGKGSCLANNLIGAMTSVCPSTTTSAIPTFLTGFPPQQHGLTGWFTWFGELETTLAVLPFVPRDPFEGQLEKVTPDLLVGVPPVFDRMEGRCSSVMPGPIADSVFNRAFSGSARVRSYNDLQEFCDQIVDAATEPGRNYVYGYWSEFDGLAHRFGVESAETGAHFQLIDRALQSLLKRLKRRNVLLLLTADHGFIDAPWGHNVRLEAHPELADTLERPLCGEPRFAFCYVKPTHREAFEAYVAEHLDRCMLVKRSGELVNEGWFGLGTEHPRLRERLGDYALIMKHDYIIKDAIPGERPFCQVGVHGGVSDNEMFVPLMIVDA